VARSNEWGWRREGGGGVLEGGGGERRRVGRREGVGECHPNDSIYGRIKKESEDRGLNSSRLCSVSSVAATGAGAVRWEFAIIIAVTVGGFVCSPRFMRLSLDSRRSAGAA